MLAVAGVCSLVNTWSAAGVTEQILTLWACRALCWSRLCSGWADPATCCSSLSPRGSPQPARPTVALDGA